MQILKMTGDRLPVMNMYCANQPVLICEKAVSTNVAVSGNNIISEAVTSIEKTSSLIQLNSPTQ